MVRRINVNVDIETPIIILRGLADSYGIDLSNNLDRLVYEINNTDFTVPLRDSWNSETYAHIAQFVNLDCYRIWSRDKLILAYENIISGNIKFIEPRFDYKSNEYPFSLDPVDCYILCRTHNIMLKPETTYSDMTYYLRILYMSRSERGIIGSDATNKSLVLRITESSPLLFDNITHKLVKTNEEAIFESVNNWGVDISLSPEPLEEYYTNYGKNIFTPKSDVLKNIYEINQYRLRFGTYFNRYLPKELYSDKMLNNFYSLEGLNDRTYEYLTEYSLYKTFHHLRQPEVKVKITPFTHDDLSDIKGIELISYGILSCSYDEMINNEMNIYSFDDLIGLFQIQKSFIDPNNGEEFSKQSIRKLINICSGLIVKQNVNEDVKSKAKELKSLIELVSIRQQGLNKIIHDWSDKSEKNDVVEQTLKTLLDSGMYMRSWRGPPHPYPVSISTFRPQDQIDKDVTFSLLKFNELNSKLSDDIKIDKLPLVKYFKGNFIESDSKHEGKTIGDRIHIVNKGEQIREMSSCIRLSSNFIIASAYRYLQLIGKPPDFQISSLIDVS